MQGDSMQLGFVVRAVLFDTYTSRKLWVMGPLDERGNVINHTSRCISRSCSINSGPTVERNSNEMCLNLPNSRRTPRMWREGTIHSGDGASTQRS